MLRNVLSNPSPVPRSICTLSLHVAQRTMRALDSADADTGNRAPTSTAHIANVFPIPLIVICPPRLPFRLEPMLPQLVAAALPKVLSGAWEVPPTSRQLSVEANMLRNNKLAKLLGHFRLCAVWKGREVKSSGLWTQ